MQINWFWLAIGLMPYFIKRQHTKDEQMLSIYVISSISWRFCIINLAHDWLEKRAEALFEPNLSLIKWRNILSHLFGEAQR